MTHGKAALEPRRCAFYLKRKNRCCAFPAKGAEVYCGNHLSIVRDDGERIPCPFDGTHSIRKDDLDHLQCCPSMLHQRSIQGKPYHREDCNAGPAMLHEPIFTRLCDPAKTAGVEDVGLSSGMARDRFEAVNKLGIHWLLELIALVKRASFEQCRPEVLRQHVPAECAAYLEPDHVRPFSWRHAIQQASIAGNLAKAGLLQDADKDVIVEFGAGKGYLSSMICDCSPAQKFVLVDNQSFRLKADRSLRRVAELQRAKVDIKDFYPPGLDLLQGQGQGQAWVAAGKHLCGAATDFTLQCCAQALQQSNNVPKFNQGANGCRDEVIRDAKIWLRGLAVAPCCHHRCSWQHYVGKETFLRLGFDACSFEIISWMTGWALCGHDAPAGTANECDAGQNFKEEGDSTRCSTSSQDGRDFQQVAKATSSLYEPQSRLGNAQKPSGESRSCLPPGEPGHNSGEVWHTNCRQTNASNELEKRDDVSLRECLDSLRLRSNVQSDLTGRRCHIWTQIPLEERMMIGGLCKRLIDHGRLQYLQAAGFQAESVLYVPSSITGENRLFVAKALVGKCK